MGLKKLIYELRDDDYIFLMAFNCDRVRADQYFKNFLYENNYLIDKGLIKIIDTAETDYIPEILDDVTNEEMDRVLKNIEKI